MAFTKKNEEAVSPVIGVILMVAITVILAAVIAAFVFGMAGNIQKTKVVSITMTRTSPTTVSATNNGGTDAASLLSVQFTNGTATYDCWMQNAASTTAVPLGNRTTCTAFIKNPDTITAIGRFADGTSQILVDQNI